jgi:hypothetical protein
MVGGKMSDDVRRYVRYRNYAEELRVMALAKESDPVGQHALCSAANDYDLMAQSVQRIIESRVALKDEKSPG